MYKKWELTKKDILLEAASIPQQRRGKDTVRKNSRWARKRHVAHPNAYDRVNNVACY